VNNIRFETRIELDETNDIINLRRHVSIVSKRRVSEDNQLKLFRVQFYEFEFFDIILDLSDNSLIQSLNIAEKMIDRLNNNK
jgi:cytidylate kinase